MGNCSSNNEVQSNSSKSTREQLDDTDGHKTKVLGDESNKDSVSEEKNGSDVNEDTKDQENNETERKRPEKLKSLDVGNYDSSGCEHISGLAVTENGFLLVVDQETNSVKCMSPDSRCLSILELEPKPNEVTALGKTKAAIGTEAGVCILNIDKSGRLKIEKIIEMGYEVWGVAEYRGNLLVTCDETFKSTSLIDLNGNRLWTIIGDKENYLFEYPCSVAKMVVKGKDVVVVADAAVDSITFINASNGKLVGRKFYTRLKPERIAVDKDNTIYICMPDIMEIRKWNKDYKDGETFLYHEDFDDNIPLAIEIDNRLGCLYVAYLECTTIDCFKLE